MSAELEQFCSRVAAGVSSGRTAIVGKARVRELTELALLHWPARHLQAVFKHGKNHSALEHAMRLCRAQVREHYEARHGVGVLWATILGTVVLQLCHFMLEDWFREAYMRRLMSRLALELAKRERQS
jgi:hypothetical protein